MEGILAAMAIVSPFLKQVRLPHTQWYVAGSGGQSIEQFLGSEDWRDFYTVHVQRVTPLAKFRYRHFPGQMLLETYYQRSHSPGASEQPPNFVNSYGFLCMARYDFKSSPHAKTFFDLGWGLQYADRRTVDLSGRLSSTPTMDLGIRWGGDDTEMFLAARFMHVSNAGFEGNNQGQNQWSVMLGFRF